MLTRTSDGGVDSFVKQDAGLSVFFQGHAEYESETLLGEYRRDVRALSQGRDGNLPVAAAGLLRRRDRAVLRERLKARPG